MRDYSQTSTGQLLRSYRFHLTDNGTMTVNEECRRMNRLHEIGAELQRRGVDLPSEQDCWAAA